MSTQGSKRVLIVLGMHRSGTSMLTRMINLHGAKLIGKMSKPNDFNESGYWESIETQQINDEILNFGRSAWFDWHAFPVASLPSDKRNYFESKITRFLTDHVNSEKAPMFVIKDPRICTLFPIWQSALRAAGVKVSIIISFRHPIEVAASLAHRDDISRNWGFLMWLRYMLDAERFSRDQPRVFLSYEKTMMDWQSSFQEMGKLLQLTWPVASTSVEVEAKGFISPDLKHHFWNPSNLGQISGLGRRAHKIYESLKKVELTEERGSLRAEFDLALAEMELLSKPIEENVPRIIRTHLAFEKKIQLINEQELGDRKSFLALRTSGVDRMAHLFTLREEIEAISSKRSKEKDSLKALAANLEKERENTEESLAIAQLQSIQLDQQKLRIKERDRNNHHLQERLNKMDEKALELLQTVRKLEKNKRELVISLSRRFEEITRLTTLLMEVQDASGPTVMPAIFTRSIYVLTNKFHNPIQFFRTRRLAKLIEKSDYFDAEWYLLQYPDVRAEGINPALHYIQHGAKEGRNPGQDFNSYEYLLANPDVAIENINPLVHFIKFGRKENRMSPPESNKRKAQ